MLKFFILLSVLFLPFVSQAEPISSHIELAEWSPSNFELKCSESPACENATFTVFYREINANSTSAWQVVPHATATKKRSIPFSGKDGQRFQFRSAATCGNDSDQVNLNSFEKFSDMTKALLMCSSNGISLSQSFGIDPPIEGRACGTFSFEWSEETAKQRDNDLVGVGFTEKMPTRDWSTYRFLEFYYWSNAPQGFKLNIVSASDEFQADLGSLSQTGSISEQWHYCVLDLDQAFPHSLNRKLIQRFAITTHTNSLTPHTNYKLLLDGVRLWRTRNFVETAIDSTPPSAPSELKSEQIPGKVTWSWSPAVDEESGIEGYSYSWSTQGLHRPPEEILITEPKIEIAFQPPAFYTTYYLKVRARNRAGLWSDIAESKLSFLPRQDDPTPAPLSTPTPTAKE